MQNGRPGCGLGHHSEQTRRNAFVANICDQHGLATLAQRKVIEEVAAHLLGGLDHAVQTEFGLAGPMSG